MSPNEIIDLTRSALWLTVDLGTPVMVAALLAGSIIGLFQALTSVQEMTLTFVPKLLVVLGATWLGIGSMHNALNAYLHGPLLDAMLKV